MLRVFQQDLADPEQFVVTLELVPGNEPAGRTVDTVKGIARDCFADGRISAVSITDNPGGNPSLSPDAFGSEIFKTGMDAIVHFTCRDLNRVGMESRALQLARLGMKNLLALTGDFTGKGFGGQGAPVFDLDSVNLTLMLRLLNDRLIASGDPDGFFTGCAVSPFKATQAESFAQYAKLCRKVTAGAQFAITQLGYDAGKFAEIIQVLHSMNLSLPVLGSVYILTPKAAALMNAGRIPGAVVTDTLLKTVHSEWCDPKQGRQRSIERAAKLGAVLKGLGYRGIHIGGVHRDFALAGEVLDRLSEYEADWQEICSEFHYPQANGFYAFSEGDALQPRAQQVFSHASQGIRLRDKWLYALLKRLHGWFFSSENNANGRLETICRIIDRHPAAARTVDALEYACKKGLLNCRHCGDCGIQHLAFLCPESQCPKHTRNGACGGSLNGMCEVRPNRRCVWTRAYERFASDGKLIELHAQCVPPRMWELDKTSSWLNFHLGRDHQSASTSLARACQSPACRNLSD